MCMMSIINSINAVCKLCPKYMRCSVRNLPGERQCREDVYSFAPHLQVDTNIYEHNDFKHINGVRGKWK